MTVKNLIQLLKKQDLNKHVRFGTSCGTVDGIINRIHENVISPSKENRCVYIECEIRHFEGERIRRKNAIGKTNITAKKI